MAQTHICITKLVQAELVSRQEDGRYVLYCITELGKEKLRESVKDYCVMLNVNPELVFKDFTYKQ